MILNLLTYYNHTKVLVERTQSYWPFLILSIILGTFFLIIMKIIKWYYVKRINMCLIVKYKVEKSNVLILLQTHWNVVLKVSSKSFEFFNIHFWLTPLVEKQIAWYFWRSVLTVIKIEVSLCWNFFVAYPFFTFCKLLSIL